MLVSERQAERRGERVGGDERRRSEPNDERRGSDADCGMVQAGAVGRRADSGGVRRVLAGARERRDRRSARPLC